MLGHAIIFLKYSELPFKDLQIYVSTETYFCQFYPKTIKEIANRVNMYLYVVPHDRYIYSPHYKFFIYILKITT